MEEPAQPFQGCSTWKSGPTFPNLGSTVELATVAWVQVSQAKGMKDKELILG